MHNMSEEQFHTVREKLAKDILDLMWWFK